jgi:hypothetical protein
VLSGEIIVYVNPPAHGADDELNNDDDAAVLLLID